jgi:hypothetical protein
MLLSMELLSLLQIPVQVSIILFEIILKHIYCYFFAASWVDVS